MAAPYSPTELRIRLRFDYPPPAIPESSDFWFLLDSENCRAVTDVSAIIRKRFYYGRQGALSLYLDGRLLHPRENVRIIRDNDTIRGVVLNLSSDSTANLEEEAEDSAQSNYDFFKRSPQQSLVPVTKKRAISVENGEQEKKCSSEEEVFTIQVKSRHVYRILTIIIDALEKQDEANQMKVSDTDSQSGNNEDGERQPCNCCKAEE